MTLILDKENPLATKVQTRDGRKARLICVEVKSSHYPIVAVVDNGGFESVERFTPSGQWQRHEAKHDVDLINAPVTHKRWVNFYRGGGFAGAHRSREEADAEAGILRIACIEIEFKEGDGL